MALPWPATRYASDCGTAITPRRPCAWPSRNMTECLWPAWRMPVGWIASRRRRHGRSDQAIAGMYKLAGVDLVRKSIDADARGEPRPCGRPARHPRQQYGGSQRAGGAMIVFRGVPYLWREWVEWVAASDRAGEPTVPPVWVPAGERRG